MKGPLESTKYLVLVALAEGPQYGTQIRIQVVGDTLGIFLSDGTLYAALNSLLKAELIEEKRPRTYSLSDKGMKLLAVEGRMHKRLAEVLERRVTLRG